MKLRAIVVGSSTTDFVLKLPHLPQKGETVLGESYTLLGGGKGANQAIALSRLGVGVTFVACVGNDQFGEVSLRTYEKEGINIKFIEKIPYISSAMALIMVDANGNNLIGVAPGANLHLTPKHVKAAEKAFQNSGILLTQLAVAIPAVHEAVILASRYNLKVILNPAPAQEIPVEIMSRVDVLTPNKTELEFLADMQITDLVSVEKASRKLLILGPKAIVTTLGCLGAFLVTSQGSWHIPATVVATIDETGAGDAFNAGLAASLLSGKSLLEAIEYGCVVGALATTKLGAQAALPYRVEIEQFLKSSN